ncbi:hypothetical protein LCGC14_1673740, partial [marine sediment metagenome]
AGTFLTQLDDSVTCTAPVADDVDPGDFPVGNYSFDTNVLFIDSSNDRVGIGTVSPYTKFSVDTGSNENLHIRSGTDFGGSGTAIDNLNDAQSAIIPLRIRANPILLDGNVGIGTVSNTYPLHIYGSSPTIAIEGSTSGNAWRMETSPTNNVFYFTEANVGSSFVIESGAGSNRIYIQSGGNIGISTSTPQNRLNVIGDGNFTSNLNVGDDLTVDTDTLFVDSGNNRVGIGTTTPNSGLHYQGDILYLTPNAGADSNDNITIKNYATSNGAPNIILKTADISGAYGISVGTLSLIGGSKTTHYGGIGGGGGKISLQGGRGRDSANNPSSYAPILLQSNGGNVGIGTTSPDRLFEIFGSASVFRFRDSGATASSTTAFIEFGGTDGGNWNRTGYIGDGSSGNTDLYFQAEEGNLRLGDSSGISVLTLQGGNVGIGTTSPDSRLQIDGNFTSETDSTDSIGTSAIKWLNGFFVNLFVSGDLNVTGNITSANVFVPQYAFTHTNETIPLTTSSVWANVTFGQEVTDILFGITHVHTGIMNHTFTFSEDGIYEIHYDFDVEDTSPSASDIDVAGRVIYENGTEIPGSVFETDIIKQDIETELSHDFLMSVLDGDKIVFQFVADDVDVQISTHGTFGVAPESATVVIKKIANL